MITTRDVLRTHDEIHSIWELGMHENAMSKNEIIKANIQKIANNIISKKEGFVFRLSGVLLCGITRLYSKKSYIFLIDCEEAIARISLRFDHTEKKKKEKSKGKGNIEIDEETARLWQGEKNIESIIELEKRDESNMSQAELILSSSEINTSPNINTGMIIDNDFGNVPFEISACTFEEPLGIPLISSDNDAIPDPYESDDDINTDNLENNEAPQAKNTKKNWYIIDSTPIIPLTQLSVILEDSSKTLCQRPLVNSRICADHPCTAIENDDLINEIKKIVEKVPVFNGETIIDDNEAIIDLPPLPSDDQNEIGNSYFDDFNDNDDQHISEINAREEDPGQEQDQNQHLYSLDIISDLKYSLKRQDEEELLNIVSDHSRRSLALSFFTALSLKNRGIVEISQTSEDSISLSKGPNFNNFINKRI